MKRKNGSTDAGRAVFVASVLSRMTESVRRQNKTHSTRTYGAFSLLSVSRFPSPHRNSLARIILATAMMLFVLAGAIPFSSLSSSHECGMECCAGKPSHMAGSCSTALDDDEQTETHVEQDDEQAAHDEHSTHLSGEDSHEVASTNHHGAANHSSTHPPNSGAKESSQTTRIASQVLTKPCSPECAAAVSASTLLRRLRDAASTTIAAGTRPHTVVSLAGHLFKPIPKSAEHRRLSRPRSPPRPLNNLSA